MQSYTKGGNHRDVSLENKTVIKALQEYLIARKPEDGMTFSLEAPYLEAKRKQRLVRTHWLECLVISTTKQDLRMPVAIQEGGH